MSLFDGSNGFVGRDVIFREVQFELYRKPSVVSYPRHAVVLNPHHTREVRQHVGLHNGKGDHSSSSNNNEEEDEEEEKDEEETGNDAFDDDDPLNLEENMMLCRNEQLRQLLHLRWQRIGPAGCGLQNLGNTCFANSVLQAIAYTPALAQYFAGTFKAACSHTVGAPYDYAFALGETVRKIHTASHGAYRPALIISNLKSLSPHFRLGRQCDAHEFLVHLLHASHRSILFRQVGSKKVAPRVEHTNALQRIIGGYLRSLVAWSRQEEIQRLGKIGKVQEAADLQISSQNHNHGKGGNIINRNSVNNSTSNGILVSKTYDPFVTLSVEVVGHNLSHCLTKLCEEETLEGRVYISPRGVGVHAKKHFKIHKPPNVLIIHLKRFNCMGGKISKFIQYPKMLDLTPFCTEEGMSYATGQLKRSVNADSSSCLYELNAICIHEGNSLNHGHYYSVVRARNGAWLMCNDERTSHCNEEVALRQQAYMLFYSKIEPQRSDPCGTSGPVISSKAVKVPVVPVMPEIEEKDVGRLLTEEEVKRIMKEKQAHKQSNVQAINGKHSDGKGDDDKNHYTHQGSPNGHNGNGNCYDDNDYNDDDDDDATKHACEPQQNGHHDKDPLSPIDASNGKTRSKSLNGKVHPMYNGIIRVIRRTTPTETAQVATNSSEVGERVVGKQAVTEVERMRQQSVPATVARPLHAQKFRQRVRDEMWEREMDRGRVKRVRVKTEEYTGENRFQKADVAFDSRGRRQHRPE
ncbi:Peptidase C19 [Trypanosoma melophagium]|uniref:Peptidase C19 n=1 Tax=Trypanosoma melophagium TaxID=715481 RepID=UPI00351A77A6|nr:Peptidase C19 [Trypanosoma melophagium]